MKKFVSLFLTLMLCISMMLIVTSCGTKHPIEKFKNKMADADSYQMSVTMSNVPLFGTITMTTKVDGNIQYTPAIMFNEEEYIETVGDTKYKYTKNEDGTWSKTQDTEEEDDSSVTSDKTMEELFEGYSKSVSFIMNAYKNGEIDAPFYTNSSQLPVGYTDDPFEALDLQAKLQSKYTGGTVLHLFMNQRISSAKVCRDFVKKVLANYRLPYITITPTFSVCPKHGYIAGEHEFCPICDKEKKAEKLKKLANMQKVV